MAVLDLRIKRNMYLILSLVTLALSVLFSAGTLFVLSWTFSFDNTSVGYVYLGNRAEEDYPTYLDHQVSLWYAAADYEIGFQGFALSLALSDFVFDAEETIDSLVRGQDNLACFRFTEAAETAMLDAFAAVFGDEVMAHFESDRFFVDLNLDMGRLYQFKTYRLVDYLDDSSVVSLLSSTQISGLPADDVDAIVVAAFDMTIAPTTRFSLLETLNDSGLTNEQFSMIASGLEEITVATGFEAFLFRPNPTLPGWAAVGRNVRIMAVNGLDFSFYNPMDFSYEFVVEKIDATTIAISLYGLPYVALHESLWVKAADVPFATEYVEDLTLGPATPGVIVIDTDEAIIYRVLVRAGVDGEIWFCNRTTTTPGNDPVTERVGIEEHPAVSAIYLENSVPKGGD